MLYLCKSEVEDLYYLSASGIRGPIMILSEDDLAGACMKLETTDQLKAAEYLYREGEDT